jgi:quercetin dioxygenase-like cupin family protein
MEIIHGNEVNEISTPGVLSRKLLNLDNSKSERISITEVHVVPGASQTRHTHNFSEQIWYALQGTGKVLLHDNQEMELKAGDIIRFAEKDVHGLFNDGSTEFVYISVTSPPVKREIIQQ